MSETKLTKERVAELLEIEKGMSPGPWVCEWDGEIGTHLVAIADDAHANADVLLCTGTGEEAWGEIEMVDADGIIALRNEAKALLALAANALRLREWARKHEHSVSGPGDDQYNEGYGNACREALAILDGAP